MSDQKQKRRLFSALGSGAYDRALSVANSIVAVPKQLLELIRKGQEKTLARLQSTSQTLLNDMNAALRLLQSFADGSYREVSKDSLVLLIAAMAYFIAPIDAIPDFFLGLGITDDLALLSWTFAKLREELEYFKTWEAQQDAINPATLALGDQGPDQSGKPN